MNKSVIALICFVAALSNVSAFTFSAMPAGSVVRQQNTVRMLFGGGKKEEGGSGGGMGNMMEQMKKAQEFGQKTKELQAELDAMKIEGASADGKAKIYFTGSQQPCGADISVELLAEGKEAVDAAVAEAMVVAHTKSLETMTGKLSELYTSMGLPAGMFDKLGK